MTSVRNDSFYINEHPKIDSALKSFYSWFTARQQISTSVDDPILSNPTIILAFTRTLSKSINAHIFPITHERNTAVLAQVWNEIKSRQEKPTRWLGRTALSEAWPDLEIQAVEEAWKEPFEYFRQEFERLLLIADLSDSKLVWSADGGQEELARRAQERTDRAMEASKEVDAKISTPYIEDVTD